MDYRESSSQGVAVTKSEWKTIGVFNRRLSLYGFETLGALVADFLTGKFLTHFQWACPVTRCCSRQEISYTESIIRYV
jgi:hypothetical protein